MKKQVKKNVADLKEASVAVENAVLNVEAGVASSHDVRVCVESGRGSYVSDVDEALLASLMCSDEASVPVEESKLYKKVLRAFSAPVFDVDGRRAELLAALIARGATLSGAVLANVDARVKSEKKTFDEVNAAPACDVPAVLAWIRNNAASEYKEYTGVNIDDVHADAVRIYSRPLGALYEAPVPVDATPAAIIKAVLSEKIKHEHEAAARRLEWKKTIQARREARVAAEAAIIAGYSEKDFLAMCARYYKAAADAATKLEKNIQNAEARLAECVAAFNEAVFHVPAMWEFSDTSGAMKRLEALPKNGVPASVRKMYADIKRRRLDLEKAKEVLRG